MIASLRTQAARKSVSRKQSRERVRRKRAQAEKPGYRTLRPAEKLDTGPNVSLAGVPTIPAAVHRCLLENVELSPAQELAGELAILKAAQLLRERKIEEMRRRYPPPKSARERDDLGWFGPPLKGDDDE